MPPKTPSIRAEAPALGTGGAAGNTAWVLLAIAWDFAFFWLHRAEQEVRLLWASQVTHHSSEDDNLSTALRQTWSPYPSTSSCSRWPGSASSR